MFLELHVIQSFPYANLNSGRDGSPKSVTYGGARRGRTSSQNSRRHMRRLFEEAMESPAVRTRNLPRAVADHLVADHGWDSDLALYAAQVSILTMGIKGLSITVSGGTSALLFLPQEEIKSLAKKLNEHEDALSVAAREVLAAKEKLKAKADKKAKGEDEVLAADADADSDADEAKADTGPYAAAAKKIPAQTRAEIAQDVLGSITATNPTIVLFGRMLADSSESDVDGVVQVAHTFTTHEVSPEIDFFSAVDDLGSSRGAGHMGERAYNSGTYYRYGSLDLTGLLRGLRGDVELAQTIAREFLKAFALVQFSAAQNNTAPHTLPALVYAELRDRPVNYAGAFESPVESESGYNSPSIAALSTHAKLCNQFISHSGNRHTATLETLPDGVELGERSSFEEILDFAAEAVTQESER